jgi:hypothetical protein
MGLKMCNNIVLDPNNFKKSNLIIDINKGLFVNWIEYDMKLLNSLLYLYSQKTEEELNNIKIGDYQEIYIKDLRDLMNINPKRNYKEIIINSLENIRNFGFNARINNKIDYTSFILKFEKRELLQLTQSVQNQKVKILFDNELFNCIIQKSNFTLLNIDINKLNSKYAMNIYQIIKMKQKQINPATKQKITSAKYNLKELNEIFDTNHKYISKFKHHFENRKKSIIKHDLIKTNFEFEFKKDCIIFKFRNLNLKGEN